MSSVAYYKQKPYSKGRMATCHPDKRHEAKGMCFQCYHAWRAGQPSVKEKFNKWQREWRKRNAEKVRAYDRKHYRAHESARMFRKYGITLEQYQELAEKNGGRCELCGNVPGGVFKLVIDHCHITGKFRGLLCHKCNAAIGMMGDNPDLLLKASDYLRRGIHGL